VRFEVTRVLDSIERRLSTDPAVARAIVDLATIVRLTELDGGRPVSLVRLGLVIDALGAHLNDRGAKVYLVVDRALMSDLELTSNEKMTLRRWSDDGLIEALPDVDDRVPELAALTGLPVVSRDDYARFAQRHGWMAGAPDLFLAPVAGMGNGSGGPQLVSRQLAPGQAPVRAQLDQATVAILGRYWRCPEPGCPSFNPAGVNLTGANQPPPRIRSGRPVCPRHDQPLTDAGPRQAQVPMLILIGGAERGRFAVTGERPVLVGRNPDDPQGVRLGEWLDDEAVQWVSRTHAQLELQGTAVVLTDTSTNGTVVKTSAGPLRLARGERRQLDATDVIELHRGVELCRADRRPAQSQDDELPLMADAPTIAIKIPQN
jgi:hypothetical protein